MTEWQRPSHCETSGCPEWHALARGGIELRSSARRGEVVTLTEQERADLVRAAQAGELGPASVD